MTDPSPLPGDSISPPDFRGSSPSTSPHEQNETEFTEDLPARRQTTARKLYMYTWSNRKNEKARLQTLMADPFLLPGSLNPHNAHCIACRQLVNLGTKRPYQTSMWIKHRDSCAQVKVLKDQGFGQRSADQNGGANGSQDMITAPKEWERYTSTFQVDIGSGQPDPPPPRVTIQRQTAHTPAPALHLYDSEDDVEDPVMQSDESSDDYEYSRPRHSDLPTTTLRPAVFPPNPVRQRVTSYPSPQLPPARSRSRPPPPPSMPDDTPPYHTLPAPPLPRPTQRQESAEPARRPPLPAPIAAHSRQSFMWRGGKNTASEKAHMTPPFDAWDTTNTDTAGTAVAMNTGFTGGSPLAHAVETAKRVKHRGPSRSQYPSQSPRMSTDSRPKLYVDTGNEGSSSLLHQPMNPSSYTRSAGPHRTQHTQHTQQRHEASDEANRFARNVENFRRARNDTVEIIQRLQANMQQGYDARARANSMPSPATDRGARHYRSSRNPQQPAVIAIPEAESQYMYHPDQRTQYFAPQAHSSRQSGYPPSPPPSVSALSTPPGEDTLIQEELENKLERAYVLALSSRGHYSNFAKLALGILQQTLVPEMHSNGASGMDMDLGSDVGETALDVVLGSAISLASRITEGNKSVDFGKAKDVFRRIHGLIIND